MQNDLAQEFAAAAKAAGMRPVVRYGAQPSRPEPAPFTRLHRAGDVIQRELDAAMAGHDQAWQHAEDYSAWAAGRDRQVKIDALRAELIDARIQECERARAAWRRDKEGRP